MIRSVPRKQDDIVLLWLALRAKGMSNGKIGKLCGKGDAHIAAITNKVMRADIAESGEAPDTVRRAYW